MRPSGMWVVAKGVIRSASREDQPPREFRMRLLTQWT